MTAEVAVMNRVGVALAADSAITIGGSTGAKIYTSADKLFQLSEHAPVGIMVYGNARLNHVPWETIIKEYRVHLGGRRLATVKKYRDDFLRYVTTHKTFFPDADQASVVRSAALMFFFRISDEFGEELPKQKTLTSRSIAKLLSEIVTKHLSKVKGQPKIPGLPKNFAATARRKYKGAIQEARGLVFEKMPISRAVSGRLEELICHFVSSQRFVEDFHAGIVLAGFGAEEHFPSLYRFITAGMVNGRLLHLESQGDHVVGESADSFVIPFAQQEMVATFMNGIDPRRVTISYFIIA